MLDFDERKEPLGKSACVIVSDDHTFGTDALLLADFAKVRKNDVACDLGSGCGIIPFIWCKNKLAKTVCAVDIQKKAISQINKGIEINGFGDKMTAYLSDLRELKGVLTFGSFDVVTMNPPYKPIGTGIESESSAEKIARHETMCNLQDLVLSAKKLLKFGGRLCICHRPERLADIFQAMRQGNIEPKRIRFVAQSQGKAPWLVLVEGKSGSKPCLTVEPQLYIKSPEGEDSEELIRIFGDYREGRK